MKLNKNVKHFLRRWWTSFVNYFLCQWFVKEMRRSHRHSVIRKDINMYGILPMKETYSRQDNGKIEL